jgi:hypothetical protein
MATLKTTLLLTSTDISSSVLNVPSNISLAVGIPSIGISRTVAEIITPTILVPATVKTKYCYVKHLGKLVDGVSNTNNTVTIHGLKYPPVRQIQTIVFTGSIASHLITVILNGRTLTPVAYASTQANTFAILTNRLLAQPEILSVSYVEDETTATFTIVSANLGETVTIQIGVTSGGVTQDPPVITTVTAASGSTVAILRPGEFLFLPVKSEEGLSAISAGVAVTNTCLLEYAYWTKLVE